MDLIDAFEARIGSALPETDDLRQQVRRHSLRRGEVLFATGNEETRFHFITSGVMKLSFLSEDGVERIRDFCAESQVFACLESLEGKVPAQFSATACEDAEIESVEYRHLCALMARHPLWLRCLSLFLLDTARNRGERERRFLMLAPPERLARAVGDRPWLLDRISQQDLAAYIGVTPVSLSRLKMREARRNGAGRPVAVGKNRTHP